jgi:hypothetical protein
VTISINLLEPDDIALIRRCLQAAAEGPFFPDWEFSTLFGLTREQVKAVAEQWPENAAERTTEMAVHNSLANLWGYPHGQEGRLEEMVSAGPERIRKLWETLKSGP